MGDHETFFRPRRFSSDLGALYHDESFVQKSSAGAIYRDDDIVQNQVLVLFAAMKVSFKIKGPHPAVTPCFFFFVVRDEGSKVAR